MLFVPVILLSLPINVIAAALFLSVAYTTITLKAQRKFGNPKKLRELNQKIRDLTKELNEMAKRGEDISKKQLEMTPHFKAQTQLMMKSMLIVLPISAIMFWYVLPNVFGAFAVTTATFIITEPITTWIFIGGCTIYGMAVTITLNTIEKKKTLAAKAAGAVAQQPQVQPEVELQE